MVRNNFRLWAVEKILQKGARDSFQTTLSENVVKSWDTNQETFILLENTLAIPKTRFHYLFYRRTINLFQLKLDDTLADILRICENLSQG